jgi:hypothetical protein
VRATLAGTKVLGRLGVGAVLAAVAAGAVGIGTVTAQSDDGEGDLVGRLVALEDAVGALPPDDVIVDPETTWGEVVGDFTGASVRLTGVAEEARTLFVDADSSGGPVAEAIANVARGLLLQLEGFDGMAAAEAWDLTFPLDSRDADGVATGADEPYGVMQASLEMVLEGRERTLAGYRVLRDAEIDADAKGLFEQRHDATVAFLRDVAPRLRVMLSSPSAQLLYAVERFETTLPGDQARARSMTVVCVDREGYEELVAGGVEAPAPEIAAGVEADRLAAVVEDPLDECLAPEAEVVPGG